MALAKQLQEQANELTQTQRLTSYQAVTKAYDYARPKTPAHFMTRQKNRFEEKSCSKEKGGAGTPTAFKLFSRSSSKDNLNDNPEKVVSPSAKAKHRPTAPRTDRTMANGSHQKPPTHSRNKLNTELKKSASIK